MKLTASGVIRSAAIERSPSFSRSSSSTMITNLPARMSAIASSTVARLIESSLPCERGEDGGSIACRKRPCDVAGEEVDLEVPRGPHPPCAGHGDREGHGGERHGERRLEHVDH